ncbi:MAG: Fe-S protein assembly co-chaperone HscB [Gemmataceae bacterium]
MADIDHFERLGLPRRFALAADELERNYLAQSRTVHPDFAGESAMEESSRLNEAYTTLRDPFRRVEYLLQLLGGPGAKEVSQAPPEFLEEMMDLRERMEDAKSDPIAWAGLEQELLARREAIVLEVGEQLDGANPDLRGARMRLNAARYLTGLLRDFEDR